jgi:hypothetical protein
MILNGHELNFYQWEGDVADHLNKVRPLPPAGRSGF